jgi:hypothetical protein
MINKTIEKILDDFVFHGASSAGIMIFKSEKLVFYKSTCTKWYDFYNNAPEKSHCHIVKNSMILSNNLANKDVSYKSFSLIWDLQIPDNDESIYLNKQREKYNHCHGISIVDISQKDILIGVPLTGRGCDINFAQDVLTNKSKIAHGLNVLKIITRPYWNKSE